MLGCFSVGAKFSTPATSTRRRRCSSSRRSAARSPIPRSSRSGSRARPPALRRELDLSRDPDHPEHRDARAAGDSSSERMPWAAQVTSLRRDRVREQPHARRPPDDAVRGAHGHARHPSPGMEIKIVDPETGERAPAGEVGELCFRGYSRFEGYYKDPEQTARGDRRGRLVPHRRSRPLDDDGASRLLGPAEGHAQGRRRERRRDRDRGLPRRATPPSTSPRSSPRRTPATARCRPRSCS